MSRHLTPIEVCEALIGSIEKVAVIAGRHPKSAYRWRYSSRSRAAGDIPSARDMRQLLEYSDRHGLGLRAEHLVRGASEADVAMMRACRPPAGGEEAA